MRLLTVKTPHDRGVLVVDTLQGEECQLKNVTLTNDGGVSIIEAYIHDTESGPVLHELDKIGCGVAYGKISMIPVLLLKPLPKDEGRWLSILSNQDGFRIKGRLAIEEMYDSISAGCSLTFDYCAMVILAAWIAAVGLATDNAVMIVASMLVSPLMGPILAGCFAVSIHDWAMLKKGLLAELVGAALTILWGFISGLVVAAWPDVAVANSWPTNEMLSRGNPNGLVTGVFFAIPSGAIVALCACAGGPTAIVGVAIAASLLPPLVNTGMTLSFAIAGSLTGRYPGPDANVFYSIAGISLSLFAINVVLIAGVCLIFFWIKRVAPVRKILSTYRNLPPAKHPGDPLRGRERHSDINKGVKEGDGGESSDSASVHVELDTTALELIVKEPCDKEAPLGLVPCLRAHVRAHGTIGVPLTSSSLIYLDYNGTTPIYPEVKDAISPYLNEHYGNASSSHALGTLARNGIERARLQVATLIGAHDDELFFTSCGTESDNWAVWGAVAARIKANKGKVEGKGQAMTPYVVTSSIEHPAILNQLRHLEALSMLSYTIVPVSKEGLVDERDVVDAIIPGSTCLISIMHSNNETGAIQPIARISRAVKAKDPSILMHTDAAQSFGKGIRVDVQELGVDLLTIVGHKLGAPKGVAALYIKRGVVIAPMFLGGGQEAGQRAGTESPLVIGLGSAASRLRTHGGLSSPLLFRA